MSEKKVKNVCLFAVLLLLSGAGRAAAAPAASNDVLNQKPADIKIEVLDLDRAITEVSQDPAALPALYDTVKEIYLRQQKKDKAISLLATYYKNRGTDRSLLRTLAYLYEQAGATTQAAEVYEKILSLDTDNDSAVVPALVGIYQRQANFDKAVDLIARQAKREPGNAQLYRQLAGIQQGRADWLPAEDSVKKAMALQPTPADYQQLAEIYLGQKSPDKALEALAEGIKKFPGVEAPLGLLTANIYLQQGDSAKAENYLIGLQWKAKDPLLKEEIVRRIKGIDDAKKAVAQPAAQPAVQTAPAPGLPLSASLTAPKPAALAASKAGADLAVSLSTASPTAPTATSTAAPVAVQPAAAKSPARAK